MITVDFSEIFERCVEILNEMPVHPFVFREQSSGKIERDAHEIYRAFSDLERQERVAIDELVSRLVLDWHVLNLAPSVWFLLEQRVRGAIYFLEHMRDTVKNKDKIQIQADSFDSALHWALVPLLGFVAPLWIGHASRLLAEGMSLDS